VIVMIVTEEHHGDGGQIVESYARRSHPTRTRERDRACPLGVHRISQQVEARDLNEERGMTDERDHHLIRSSARRASWLDRDG
jgi:hypothetical protein